MDNKSKLLALKSIHTLIWLVMAAACFYILYSCIVMKFGIMFYASVILIIIECIALAVCSMACPLRIVAMEYTDKVYDGFDIFLPAWVARHNVAIFTCVLGASLIIWLYNKFI